MVSVCTDVCVQWTDAEVPQMIASSKYPDQRVHRDLKEQLYCDVIEYFNKGKASLLVVFLILCRLESTQRKCKLLPRLSGVEESE